MAFDEEPEGDPHGECAKEISDLMLARDRYKDQVDIAMRACTVSGHDKNHKYPGHCVTALSSILESRDTKETSIAREIKPGEKIDYGVCVCDRGWNPACPQHRLQ